MSNLQDRINDEINNIVALPDPLTPEQREHLKTFDTTEEMHKYIEKCIEKNTKSNQ